MPCTDLIGPLRDGPPVPAHIDGHGGIGEVAADLSDPGVGEARVGVVVDLADHLLGVPREPHLLSGVASTEQTEHTHVFVIGESFTAIQPRRAGEPFAHPRVDQRSLANDR